MWVQTALWLLVAAGVALLAHVVCKAAVK